MFETPPFFVSGFSFYCAEGSRSNAASTRSANITWGLLSNLGGEVVRVCRPGLIALQAFWPDSWRRGGLADALCIYKFGRTGSSTWLFQEGARAGVHCVVRADCVRLCTAVSLWLHIVGLIVAAVRLLAPWQTLQSKIFWGCVWGSYSTSMLLQLCNNGSCLDRAVPLLGSGGFKSLPRPSELMIPKEMGNEHYRALQLCPSPALL